MEKNIKDIAREAGVSIATVSKVINGYPHVSRKTREKVMRIIQDSNFVPNSVARSLVRRRSMTIGLLLTTSLLHPFFHGIMAGIEKALKRSGYDLMYLAQIAKDKSYSVLQHCRSRNVEGLLAFGYLRGEYDWSDFLRANMPAMFIDVDITGERAGYITSDNEGAIRTAVRYLHGLGHRRIAILTGLPRSLVAEVRVNAYRETMAELGLPVPDLFIAVSDFKKEGGHAAAARLLALPERPTAILCSSDIEAIGVMDAAREAGLRVPEDLSVIGFDDIEVASHCMPPLTTIRQDAVRLGEEALEQLVMLIQDPKKKPPVLTIPTELVIRESCAAAPDR